MAVGMWAGWGRACITSTRNTFRPDSSDRKAGGHGMEYAVLADARICMVDSPI